MTNKFKIKKISLSIVKKFKNKERFSFFQRTLAELDMEEFTSEHTRMLIENARSYLLIQDDLSKTPLAHSATPEIQERIDECHGHLTRITSTISSLRNLTDKEGRHMYKTLTLWLRSASPISILTKVRVDQEAVMQALRTAYEADGLIGEYLEALSLTETYNKAVGTNAALISLTTTRDSDRGHYKEVRLLDREEAIFNLQLLVNEIVKMAHIANDDQEIYQRLCRSIKSRVTEARRQYEARMTRLANGQTAEDDVDENQDEIEDDNLHGNGDDIGSEGSNTTPDPDASADFDDDADEESTSSGSTND